MSTSPAELFDQVADLTELYLRDEITADQLAELETMVRDNAQAADAMRTVLKQAGTMRVVFSEQRQFTHRIGEVNRDEYLSLLQALIPAEEPEPVHLVGHLKTGRPLWRQWPVVIPSAIAALLAIAVTLIITMSSTQTVTNTPNFAQVPDEPAASSTVATLTAERDAIWAKAALAAGSALQAGQRLTLTHGFAEITTQRGAVAILEAPATIELLDNNNAIRLHTGKLVGLCETEPSKGFLVRTPHMDISDLGTRFGVDASQPDATEVHVFEGEVEVSSPVVGRERRVNLISQEAMRADRTDAELIAFAPSGFQTGIKIAHLQPRFAGLESHWLGRPPSDLRAGQQTSKALQVYLEQAGIVLDKPVAVDIDRDTPWSDESIGSRVVAADQRVDVYLLHLDTPGLFEVNRRDGKFIIHFDREIFGVIGAESALRETDATLGVSGVMYPPLPDDERTRRKAVSGIDTVSTAGSPDIVRLINEGKSLELRLNCLQHMDQLRVLVQAADQ